MTITPRALTRAAGVAAAVAGLLFLGVQVNHPHMDVTSVTTTDWVVRNTLKMLMAALALTGITGMYLHQVTKMGVLGLLGYVLFGAGYIVMLGIEFVAAYVLPALAERAPGYVNDVLAVAFHGTAIGDIGLMGTAVLVSGIGYLAGGFIFGIALFRANILTRWAAALLTVGTLATIAIPLLPQINERLFAIPTGVALIGLGYSLWRQQRTPVARPATSVA
ncbi:hypothetical protein [Actinocrispum wychmicini]|uniref:DUF4386 family protein n=1 Tax=Actinocrispum wychmicini TaxID=1213861 RepID=A0A4R2ILQ7_9PSEU|nr:hypothetical protein [Actinocrispum wychmicini]TCO45934.1 hypothetical protein EV192_120120 [Actinocrispum wychmicini]